jgi:phage shock protein PspC (stress-responsive transcriptional regulator)
LGLVRPINGRYIAGVCAALGRATNTDPILWRVLLPALTLLGGIGLLVYVFGWLLIPSEGDEVSPFESLIGRGRSRTSPWLAAILTAIAAFAVIGIFADGPGAGAILVAAVVAAIVLVLSRGGAQPAAPADQTQQLAPTRKPTGARRILFSLVLLAIGGLALLDLSNVVDPPASAYFALAVAVLGIGMMIASFTGRVRGPVTLGILLTLGLAATTAAGDARWDSDIREVSYQPASAGQLLDRYDEDSASITLDLTRVDFAGVDRVIDVHVNVGEVRVLLPANVDTTIDAKVHVGDVTAFDHRNAGINPDRLTATDYGLDGPGGGTLHINADVNVGEIEVIR